MTDKKLKSFLETIDKIVSGELIQPSEYQQYDEEDKELLYLAQVLAERDINSQEDELADDELDMVAGGVKADVVWDKKQKKEK